MRRPESNGWNRRKTNALLDFPIKSGGRGEKRLLKKAGWPFQKARKARRGYEGEIKSLSRTTGPHPLPGKNDDAKEFRAQRMATPAYRGLTLTPGPLPKAVAVSQRRGDALTASTRIKGPRKNPNCSDVREEGPGLEEIGE